MTGRHATARPTSSSLGNGFSRTFALVTVMVFVASTTTASVMVASGGRTSHPEPPACWTAVDACRPATPTEATAPSLEVTKTFISSASPVGPMLEMSDVTFADAAHGWASGNRCPATTSAPCDGVVEATSDGGRDWATVWNGPVAFSDLQFFDDTHGVGLVRDERCLPEAEISAGCPESVMATADAGREWTPLYTTISGIGGIRFATADIGWIATLGCPNATQTQVPNCVGHVLATFDGGRHWVSELQVNGAVLAVTSFGDVVWAAASNPPPPGASISTFTPVTVWSSVAGRRWVRTGTIPTQGEFDPLAIATIAFSSPANGWSTVFEQVTCAMHGCGVAASFHTTDGGRSWTLQPLPVSDGQCGGGSPTVSLKPGGQAVGAMGVNLGACAPPESVLATYSASSWRPVHDFELEGIGSMAWTSEDAGWATTNSAIIHTDDGGRTWDQQFPAPRPTVSIAFTSALDGWGAATVSDPSAVLRTTDGGDTWTVIAELSDIIQQLSVAGDDVWAAEISPPDGYSSVARSTDGGRTWTTIYRLPTIAPPQGPITIGDLSMFGNTGVLVTTTGVGQWQELGEVPPFSYFATTDGGQTWRPRGIGLDVDNGLALIDSSSFADALQGWRIVTASIDAVEATDDGSTTWHPLGALPSDMTFGPVGVELSNDTDGYVWAGSPALNMSLEILATTDAGRTWTSDYVPNVRAASTNGQVDFVDAQHGWILASGLWATTDGGLIWTQL